MAKKGNSKSTMPVGVKVLSVLSYIGALLLLIAGIFLLIGSGFIASMISTAFPTLSILGTGLFIFLGILFILWAVLDYFIGRGLWRGQNWARILLIVLSALSLVSSLTNPLENIVGIIINAVIIWYLGFSDAKKAFN